MKTIKQLEVFNTCKHFYFLWWRYIEVKEMKLYTPWTFIKLIENNLK